MPKLEENENRRREDDNVIDVSLHSLSGDCQLYCAGELEGSRRPVMGQNCDTSSHLGRCDMGSAHVLYVTIYVSDENGLEKV